MHPRILSLAFLAASGALIMAPKLATAQSAAGGKPTRYYNRAWSFDDVDVGKLVSRLGRVGLNLPVTLSGNISGTLNVGVPWNSLRDARAWRFGGSLTSPELKVSDFVFRNVAVRLQYRDGALRLDELRVQVPPPEGAPGSVGALLVTARMELVPRGQFTATVTVTDMPMATVLRSIPTLQPVAGSLSGNLNAQVAIDQLRDIAAWSVTGPVALRGLTVRGAPPAIASVQVELKGGQLAAHQLKLVVGPAALTSEAQVSLLGQRPWTSTTEIATGNLPALLEMLGRYTGSNELAHASPLVTRGELRGTARVGGTLSPLTTNIAGHAELQNVTLQPPRELVQRVPLKPLAIPRLAFDYTVANNAVSLSQINASLAGGQLTGSATLQIGEKLGGSAALAWKGIDAGVVMQSLGLQIATAAGKTDGSITLTVPAGTLGDRTKWAGTAALQVEQLNVYGLPLQKVDLPQAQLAGGNLSAPKLTAQLDGRPLEGSATLTLQSPWALVADVSATQLQLARATSLPPLASWQGRVAGRADASAHIEGTLAPFALTANGDAVGEGIIVDKHALEHVSLNYSYESESLQLSAIDAKLYDGRLTGSALIPFTADGPATAAIAWSHLDAGRILGEFVAPSYPMQGHSDGDAKLTIPPGEFGNLSAWEADANVKLPKLLVRGVDVASIDARLAQHARELGYHAEGTVLGGTLWINGARVATAPSAGLAALGNAELRLEGARIGTAADAAVEPSQRPSPVTGIVNVNVSTTAAPAGWSWRGAANMSDLAVAGKRITPGVEARVAGNERRVELEQFSGEFAGGQLGGSGEVRFGSRRGGLFRVTLRSGRLEQVVKLAQPGADSSLTGPVDVNVNLNPGQVWRINGDVSSVQADAQGVRFSNFHMPIDADWRPGSNHVRLYASSVATSLAGGRVTGRLTAERTSGWNLDGNLKFSRVDVGVLARQTGSQSTYGRGQLTGKLKMTSRNMTSVNDLRATLSADLDDTQATSIPVVSQLRSFIPGFAVSGSSGFQQGRVEARLDRGVVHVDRLSLASNQIQLYVSGLINLSGRLRLDATVALGAGNNPVFAQFLFTRLAAVAVPPAALLIEANDFLSNRVIYAEIGGTLHRPAIRLKPAKILRAEVVRFFLRESTGAVLPAGLGPAVGGAAAGSAASHR